MGYVLRMSSEIHDWLIDLRATDPTAAQMVGESLIALMSEGARLGPPMVISLLETTPQLDPREALDSCYQTRLVQLQVVRRSLADAAALAGDIERQIAQLMSAHPALSDQSERAGEAGDHDLATEAQRQLDAAADQVAELRRMLPGVVEAERNLSERLQRSQAAVDSFRIRKETLKARYTAALSERAIHEFAAAAADTGEQSTQDPDPDTASATAADNLLQIVRAIERELVAEQSADGLGVLRVQPGLMELRPGAPGNSELRVLFAFQPPGTALLIAVLEGGDAVRGQHREAVLLSSEVLRRAQAGQAPEAAEQAFDGTSAFLDEFFPGSADEVAAGAAARVAANRARTLAEQRAQLGLTQAQVAERMGVRQERVSAIERAAPGATEVRTLVGYVEALGGRLEIIADFGGERVLLH